MVRFLFGQSVWVISAPFSFTETEAGNWINIRQFPENVRAIQFGYYEEAKARELFELLSLIQNVLDNG